MIAAHTDVVGSLLRPPELLQAQKDLTAGRMTDAAFKRIEDEAVDDAVRLQEDAGLAVVTDGEMRRLSFQSQMVQAVDGFGDWGLDAFLWGDWHGDETIGDASTERPAALGVVERLRPRRYLSVDEFIDLRARTSRIPKITLPSPGLFMNFYDPERSKAAYPTLDGFLADVVAIVKRDVTELARLGAPYIQIDAPHYPLLLGAETRAFYESRGWTWRDCLARWIELDNAVMAEMNGVTFGFHLCRGNQGSRWLVEGGYDAIAAPIFERIRAHRLLLEYDDARSGSFEPLRHVPEDKTVVLGLITTKRPDLEDRDLLIRRIEEASRYVPLERLALSPQCGFATSVIGNALTIADQKRKLARLTEAARTVWG